MKKFIICAAILVSLALASCNSATKTDSDSVVVKADTTVVADTITE